MRKASNALSMRKPSDQRPVGTIRWENNGGSSCFYQSKLGSEVPENDGRDRVFDGSSSR
mgnify:CR=1 FL=1